MSSIESRERVYAGMCIRLRNALWDPVEVLGPNWEEKIGQYFTEADLACARAIIDQQPPRRYVGILRAAGEVLATEQGQKVVAASSMELLLAHFLQVSMRFRCAPDEVRIDQQTGKIELLLRGVPLADLLTFSPAVVANTAVDRAEAILLGLDRDGPASHLHDRLHAWPRLQDIGIEHSENGGHVPSTAGWLLSAYQLASQNKLPTSIPELIERLAAAVLGAPQWAMLACGRTAVAEACGPWYLKGGDPLGDPVAIYASPLHAAAALFEGLSTGRFLPGTPRRLRMYETAEGYPRLVFDDPPADGGVADWWEVKDRISMEPCDIVDPPAEWVESATRALEAGTTHALEEAFGAHWLSEDRLRAYDNYHCQRELVQSGHWRFTVNAVGEPRWLAAHRIDHTGRSVFTAVVRTSTANLLRFNGLKGHVLTASGMCEPVALIDGIDNATARILADVLGDAGGSVRHNIGSLDEDARLDLRRVASDMNRLLAVYPVAL